MGGLTVQQKRRRREPYLARLQAMLDVQADGASYVELALGFDVSESMVSNLLTQAREIEEWQKTGRRSVVTHAPTFLLGDEPGNPIRRRP